MIPVPRVSVMNSPCTPISPRAGMRYSRRTRPCPSGCISLSSPRLRPSSSITAPWCRSSTAPPRILVGRPPRPPPPPPRPPPPRALVLLLDAPAQHLVGLAARAADLPQHHARARHRQLVAFAAHVLQQDREVQLAASRDQEHVGVRRVLHAQRHVAHALALEPLPALPAGGVPAPAPRERRAG